MVFIPTPVGGIQPPAITGTWPGSLTTSVQDTTTPITTLPRFVSITSLDSTHAVATYNNGLNGAGSQMIIRPLEIVGTSIVRGTTKLLQNRLSISVITETAAMTPTRFVTAIDNISAEILVEIFAPPAIVIISDVVLAVVVPVPALNIDRGAHGNGTYFSLIGDGVFMPNNQPRFTSYYFNGSAIVNIADNLTLTPDAGMGHIIHNLTNNLCAMAFRKMVIP